MGCDGHDTLPCLWGELHPGPACPGRWQEGKELSLKYPVILACYRAGYPVGKGPFPADLGSLLWSKTEQGDKSESDPLLHTFIQGGSIF